jgi:hypothetical protein
VKRTRRRWIAASSAAVLALIVLAGAFAATRPGDRTAAEDPAATSSALRLTPADIYPSLARPAPRVPRPDYPELFVTGQSLAEVVEPACRRYRSAMTTWSKRARSVHRDSLGAGMSPKTAARWYAGVVWVSQDEAGELRRALARISRARVSAATRGAVKRGSVVATFTTDALTLCGLAKASARAYGRLDRLDRRTARLIALARLNTSSGTDVNVIQ